MGYKKKMQNEIERRLEQLEGMDPASQEYAATVDSIAKLMDRLNEIKSRRGKIGVEIGTAATSAFLAMWWAVTSLKFEGNGTITSSIGRKTLDMIHKLNK